jgi:hypothetical protein
MTQAILQGLGYRGVPLPKQFVPPPYAGLIRHWIIRTVSDEKNRLNEKSVADILLGEAWKDYELPEKSPLDGWWLEHERQRGAALSLESALGKAPRYCGITYLEERADRDVVFKIGASLQTLWLNGKQIYAVNGWNGWHLGRDQVSARLTAGKNTIMIETGSQFILTVTNSEE